VYALGFRGLLFYFSSLLLVRSFGLFWLEEEGSQPLLNTTLEKVVESATPPTILQPAASHNGVGVSSPYVVTMSSRPF